MSLKRLRPELPGVSNGSGSGPPRRQYIVCDRPRRSPRGCARRLALHCNNLYRAILRATSRTAREIRTVFVGVLCRTKSLRRIRRLGPSTTFVRIGVPGGCPGRTYTARSGRSVETGLVEGRTGESWLDLMQSVDFRLNAARWNAVPFQHAARCAEHLIEARRISAVFGFRWHRGIP